MPEERIYQHPLAYLLGLEGLALIRAFKGEYGREFTLARIAEVRDLLARADEFGDGVSLVPITAEDVYADWATAYDGADNNMVRTEQPAVWAILDRLPVGTALDAACGTGRHAAHLVELGHEVIGTDASLAMLKVAGEKLPGVDLRQGELNALALDSGSVDLVVCGLALMHVPELEPVLAEFARVLAPGGHLVLSDWRAITWNAGEPFVRVAGDRSGGYAPGWSRSTSEYLRTALALGFELRGIEELVVPEPFVDATGTPPGDREPAPEHRRGAAPNQWALHRFAPEATNAAYRDKPLVLVLHLQLNDTADLRDVVRLT